MTFGGLGPEIVAHPSEGAAAGVTDRDVIATERRRSRYAGVNTLRSGAAKRSPCGPSSTYSGGVMSR